ncbi:hypothetical protein C8R43DRAFT_110144 [Mycena crocata]|nr:hypothetical protein C8R43DRAFT_110144 [Mycena crocata]
MRVSKYSRMKASFKSWSSPRPQATRLKRPIRPSPEARVSLARSKKNAGSHGTAGAPQNPARKVTKDGPSSFLSMSRKDEKVVKRELRKNDDSHLSVNRFGWPLGSSRKSGKRSYNTESVAARPEAGAIDDCKPLPRSRASFEVDLSPIMEDIYSFPSVRNMHFRLDTGSIPTNDGGQITKGAYQEPEYQEDDSRNFDHMNLSGSFVLQSTSCRDMQGRNPVAEVDELVPALVLTFPTPELPKSPIFAPQSPFTVHKFVAATAGGSASTSAGWDQRSSNLFVPALPRCTHCGFGFGLDFHDLETPLNSKPCRFCEPQWLACKMWYQARSNSLREPGALRPAESNASSRAMVGKLGLPVGSHRGLGLEIADELGQLHDAAVHAKAAVEGYSSFSNVNLKDRTRTKRTVWKKLARLFGTHVSVVKSKRIDLAAEPESRRNWIGPSPLVGT